MNSNSSNQSLSIAVTGKQLNFVTNLFHYVLDPVISNFAIFPVSFMGLETSCTDSDPYDNFTLTCTASKPALVLPDLEVIWYHNGTIMNGGMTTTNDNTITSTLHVTATKTYMSSYYTCQVNLNILQSNNITTSGISVVTIKRKYIYFVYCYIISIAMRKPFVPQIISVNVSTTSATVVFTIPSIAYTPENYSIQYIGFDFQNTLINSMNIQGTNNITDVNEMYQITLSNLEEANTYNFTVVSTNCIGSTSTVVMNFTTLPSCKCNILLTICIVSIYSTCCSTNRLYKHHLPPS